MDEKYLEYGKGEATELPGPLYGYKRKLDILALLITIAIIVIAIVSKTWQTVLFLAIPAYLVVKAFLLLRKWNLGAIRGASCTCTQLRKSAIKDRILVTFLVNGTEEEEEGEEGDGPVYLQFSVPGKKRADEFVVSARYQVYFYTDQQSTLIAYEAN